MDGFVIKTYFKGGEHRFLHDQLGQIFVDGYSEHLNQKYAFEYNGCKFHYCPHCGSNPDKKKDEEIRQRNEI